MPPFCISCRSYVKTGSDFSFFPTLSFFVLVETAVNIGYSCKLLYPDTRLLEWQELRLAMIQNTQMDTGTCTHSYRLIDLCVFWPCRQILQSPDPVVSFSKARQTELWAVDKETAAAKTAVVLTGPELVNTGLCSKWVTYIIFKHLNICCHAVCNCQRVEQDSVKEIKALTINIVIQY